MVISRRKTGFPPGVRTCELFLYFVTIVRVRAIVLTSLFSLFYVTCEFTGSYTEVEPKNERLPRQISWLLIFSDSFYTVKR